MAISDRSFRIHLVDEHIHPTDLAVIEMAFDQLCDDDDAVTLKFMRIVKEQKRAAIKRLLLGPLSLVKGLFKRNFKAIYIALKSDFALVRHSNKDLYTKKVIATLMKEEEPCYVPAAPRSK